MRYLLCLLILLGQVAYARLDLEAYSRRESKEETSFNTPKKLGFFSLDIGLSYFYWTNKTIGDGLSRFYGDVNLLPVVRGAYFFDLHPFAIGLGAQVSYMKKRTNTSSDPLGTTRTDAFEELVYLPYQVFVDFKYYAFRSFLMLDAWLGYEEAYIQNRRACSDACNTSGKVWISDFGKYWNSYLSFGGSVAFSLKGLNSRNFSQRGYLEPRNIYVKLFYEHNISLGMKELLGGRKVNEKDFSKGQGGLTFVFEI